MASFLALGFIFLTGWLIIQRYKSQAILLMSGLMMMFAAHLLGTTVNFVPVKESTGWWFFDFYKYIDKLAAKDVADLGLMIMVCTGFAKYMDHIGASARLVSLALRPLARLKAPYLVMVLGYFANICMALPIPSASGLAMLMMVTLFPILTSLGVSRAAAASAIATGHLMDFGPASATSLLVSRHAGIPVTQYFVNYQLPVMLCCAIVSAAAHYFWQRYLDKKEGLFLEASAEPLVMEESKGGTAPGPLLYVFLPILPMVFLLGFSEYGYEGIKITVNVAMFVSLTIAMLCEFFRYRCDLRKVSASIQVFFKGMGDQFTTTVTLITAGQTFAYGLQCLGIVATVISAAQGLGVGAGVLTFLAAIIILLLAMIMGSGVAPLFAFVPLLEKFAKDLGAQPVLMLLPLQNAASLGRLMSPITAVIIAVSNIANISPFELVKRNSVPVLCTFITSTIASAILF